MKRDLGPLIELKVGDVVKHKTQADRRMVVIGVNQPHRASWLNETLYTIYGSVHCRYPRDKTYLEFHRSKLLSSSDYIEESFFPFELER